MENIYKELEQKRKELHDQYDKYRKKAIPFVISLLVGIALFIISMNNDGDVFSLFGIIFGFVGFIGMGIYFGKASKFKSDFSKLVKSEFVDKILSEQFQQYEYHQHNHVSIGKINDAGLVRRPDRYRGEDLIIGSYNGVSFSVSDITLEEKHVTRTKNGTTVTYVTYFKGRWYTYKFPKKFNQTLKIVEGGNIHTTTQGLRKYETEMIEFNKKFSIFASDEQFFFYIVNPYLIERLMMLENAHRGRIYYCIKNDELHIGINDGSDSLEVTFNKQINAESFKRFTEDIVLIKNIIEEFRLDNVKFKNS
ncbi:MAG: DUF3137 domain-containing protein [Acholeplasma sp.]|nr:DUF3137 domain-containing protein [Acholeplasma sp.]